MNQPQMPWLDNPALAGIAPEKLELLLGLYRQAEGKSMQEALPFLLTASSRLRKNGTAFSAEEFQILFQALKKGKTPEELQKMEQLIRLFSSMNPR